MKSIENTCVPYLSASAVVIHYEEPLYQVYAPLPCLLTVKRGQPKPASFCMSAYNDRQTTIVGAVICPGGVIPEVIEIGLIYLPGRYTCLVFNVCSLQRGVVLDCI